MPCISTPVCDGWVNWVNGSATNTIITTPSNSTTTVWHNWVTSNCTTTAYTTGAVWQVWCDTGTGVVNVQDYTEQYMVQPRAPSEQELQECERLRTEREAERAKREAAEQRAEQLLVENLSLRQRNEYLKHKHFVVHGRQHRYLIRKGRTGNIDVVAKDGKVLHRLCAHPGEAVPDCDTMLAQKLWLEFQEEDFLRKANRHQCVTHSERALEALH